MFNTVILSGRITANPELKTTPNGVSVCSFTIANEVGFGDNKKTSFIPVVAWRGAAEVVAKHFTKGNMIGIEGSVQTRKYQDKDGNNRTAFEVVANNVQFMGYKETQGNDNYSPSQTQNSSYGSNSDASEFTEVDLGDDLPF